MLGFKKNNKIHFIGIGGIGMSGIAEILSSMGYQVSGSDINTSVITDKLKTVGVEIYTNHQSENLKDASLVVYSSAIDQENPEIIFAKKNKIPIIKRAEMLSELMRLKFGIAIAGSHGKTTTTSLVATIFNEAMLDATHIIGGIVQNLGGHAKKGDGQYLIAEADESDGSFLLLNPIVSIITNIDNDHLDFYQTEENIVKAFSDFANKVPFYGRVILNAKDKNTNKLISNLKRPFIQISLCSSLKDKSEIEYSADKITYKPGETTYELFHFEKKLGEVKTHLSGEHNVLNSLAAVALALEIGLSLEIINKGLDKFKGVSRRLETIYRNENFHVIDDYGHHPTEILATLKTLKNIYKKKICVVFEPHRYSRTKQLWNDFLNSFNDADEVYISPIYAASEAAIPGITGEKLTQDLSKKKKNVFYLKTWDQMSQLIEDKKNSEMIFLTMGAGSISKRIRTTVSQLK